MDPDVEDDDDWTKYADTGYESTYDPWADMVEAEESEEEDFEDEFENYEDDQVSIREIHASRAANCFSEQSCKLPKFGSRYLQV